jgi:hypothetical protein
VRQFLFRSGCAFWWWPKHVTAKCLLTPFNRIIPDGVLLLVYVLRVLTVQDVLIKKYQSLTHTKILKCDSKLLSGFPLPIIFKPEIEYSRAWWRCLAFAILFRQVIIHLELHFHIPYAVLFCCFRFENYGPRNPDNKLESFCISFFGIINCGSWRHVNQAKGVT